MLRSTVLCTALASTLFACTADSTTATDELAGESELDDDSSKSDKVASEEAFTYFTATTPVCIPEQECNGFFVERLNRSDVKCGRATVASCLVSALDWSHSALPASVAASYENRLRNGENIILRGDVGPSKDDRDVQLAVTEVWVPQVPTSGPDGVFVLARSNGIVCVTEPCPHITEYKLNSYLSAMLTDVDFSVSGGDKAAIERGMNAMFEDGVIVAGHRMDGFGALEGSVVRGASQFYVKAPVPQF
jgi:hypothetical protein